MAKMGRPRIDLTDELQERICRLVSAGDPPEVAAGVCDVERRTYFRWKKRGLEGEEPYATFVTYVTRAIDQFRSRSRRVVLRGDGQGIGFGPAKARLEVLARRFPQEWAQRVNVHIEEGLDHFLEVAERVLDREQYVKLMTAIATDDEQPSEPVEHAEH